MIEMHQKTNPYYSHVLILSSLAFVLNLIWEYVQCPLFFIHEGLPPTHRAMLIATFGDVIITWCIYLAVALKRRDFFWSLKRWRQSDIVFMVVLALVIATLIEHHALQTGRWSYTPITPLLPGTSISLIPIVQLLLLVPLSLWLKH